MTPSAQVPFRRFRKTVKCSDKRLQFLVVLPPFPLEVLGPDKTDLIQSPDPLFAQTPVLPPFSLGIALGRKRTVFPFRPASAGIKKDFQRMVFPLTLNLEHILFIRHQNWHLTKRYYQIRLIFNYWHTTKSIFYDDRPKDRESRIFQGLHCFA